MNRNHPLDEVFRRKLEAYEVEIPPHIFGQIQEKRNKSHLLMLQIKSQLPLLLLYSLLSITAFTFYDHHLLAPSSGLSYQQASSPGLKGYTLMPTPNDNTTATALISGHKAKKKKTPRPKNGIINKQPAAKVSNPPGLKNKAVPPASKEAASLNPRPTTIKPVANLAPLRKKSNHPGLYQTGKRPILGFQPSPRCPRFGPDNWRIYLEALVAPDIPFRFISADAPDLETYVARREATEKQQLAYSSSLRLSLVSNKGFVFRAGATFSQINERFRYLNESEIRTIVTDIYDQNGNIIGTDTALVLGTRYKVSQNKYRMLDIPVIFGYQFKKKAMRLSVNAGLLVNLAFRQKGDLLSPIDLQPVSIDSGTPDAYPAFKQQAGLGWYGSLGLEYELGTDLYLMLEPYAKSFPRSLTTAQYGVQQRYFHAGIFIGLKKALN
jgi:hypothetical protein